MGKCVKRHLALLLCLMLCLSLFPAAAFAEGGETTANEITGGEPIPAERPEETAEADVVEEEAAVTAETEGVIPSEAGDVIPEEEEAYADAAEEEERDREDRKYGEDDGERRGGLHVGHNLGGDVRAGDGDGS